MEGEIDFKGFEISDLHETVLKSGENDSETDIEQWLNMDESDPGYQILSQEDSRVYYKG